VLEFDIEGHKKDLKTLVTNEDDSVINASDSIIVSLEI